MTGNIIFDIIIIVQIVILVSLWISISKIKGMKLDFTKNSFYKELHYIKALLVAMTIVLVFFGWNISANVRNDVSQDLKAKIEQDFSTALNGFIVEVPLDTCKTEITYKFKDLKDIKGNPVNNNKSFQVQPIVSLNYLGQPYTITEVTNEGFTVKKLAIFKGYKIAEMLPPAYDENKLIIWIINRD